MPASPRSTRTAIVSVTLVSDARVLLQPVVPVSGTDVLWDMTATKVTATTFVVCYRRLSASTGRCQLGTANSTGVTFWAPYDVFDSATYIDGVVTNLHDATDRVLLSFSVSTTESSKVVVIGISGTTLSTVTPSSLTRFQFSSMCDNLASVALTSSSVLLAYRVSVPWRTGLVLLLHCG
jgi:hypothetical protein